MTTISAKFIEPYSPLVACPTALLGRHLRCAVRGAARAVDPLGQIDAEPHAAHEQGDCHQSKHVFDPLVELGRVAAQLVDFRREIAPAVRDDPFEHAHPLLQPLDMRGILRRFLRRLAGLQFHLASGETVHFRASGNAPELRCYVEAGTPEKASGLLGWAMDVLKKAVR